MARYSKAAQERREMDMARDAAARARDLKSLSLVTPHRPTAGHLDAAAKLQAFKARTCNSN